MNSWVPWVETLGFGQASLGVGLIVLWIVIGSVARRVRKLEGGK